MRSPPPMILAVSFGREHVDAQREVRPLGIGLHVERLDRRRIAVHEDGAVELFGDGRLVRCSEVAAPFERQSLLLQQLRRVVVLEPREGSLDVLELCRIPLEDLQLALAALEHAPDDRDDERLGEIHDIVQRRVHFRLDHPELGEMAPRLGFLRAERRAEAVHAAERHGVRLVVQLPLWVRYAVSSSKYWTGRASSCLRRPRA